MPGYLANKSPLFVKVHSMQKGFIIDEDLVSLGDDPDLISDLSVQLSFKYITAIIRTSELSSSIVGRGRYWTGFLLNNTWKLVIRCLVDRGLRNSYHGGLWPEATIISRHRSDVAAWIPKNFQLRFYNSHMLGFLSALVYPLATRKSSHTPMYPNRSIDVQMLLPARVRKTWNRRLERLKLGCRLEKRVVVRQRDGSMGGGR